MVHLCIHLELSVKKPQTERLGIDVSGKNVSPDIHQVA